MNAALRATDQSDPTRLSLHEVSALLRRKLVSPVELTRACLDRIQRWNPVLNAFIAVTDEQALAQARQAESEIRQGKWRGPLHGIPIGLKDNIDTAGVRTTAASGVFEHRVPDADAEVVRRLKAAGAVLIGKLNMHEFAVGATSGVSYFGPIHNPWAPAYMSGGSSGGSASAVARASASRLWVPTPAALFESPPPTAASLVSSRRTAA
jgi:aspartyl-tRNA(Asn)/glutamyl-tRNA(Gln) amidotransferase subunit A